MKCQAEQEGDTLTAPPAGTRLSFQKCNAQPYFGNKSDHLWGSKKKLRGPLVEGQRSGPGKTRDSGEEKKQVKQTPEGIITSEGTLNP